MTDLEQLQFPHLKQDVYQAQLASGLKLVVIPKPGFKETTAMLQVDFGGVDTSFTVDGQVCETVPGLAHFLEHQVFENWGKEDFAQLFTSLGSDSNAFTGFTSTNYFFSGLDKIKESLLLLLDLVGQRRFTDLSIIKEKTIIAQEIEMYQDDPDHRLYSAVLAGLYPETALALDLAGTVDSIDKIGLTDLSSAFDTFYHCHQMTLVVVGDLVAEEVYSWVTAHLDKTPKGERITIERSAITHQPVVKKQSFQMDVAMPKLGLGFRALPTGEHALLYKTGLGLYLNMILGWTSASYQAWYDKGKIDDSFDMTVEVTDRFQFVMFLLDTAEPIAMSAKIKQVLKKGRASQDVSEEHLFTLKKELYGEFLSSLDRVDELASLYLEESSQGANYLELPDILDELTLDRVLAIGESFFQAAEGVDVTIFPV